MSSMGAFKVGQGYQGESETQVRPCKAGGGGGWGEQGLCVTAHQAVLPILLGIVPIL